MKKIDLKNLCDVQIDGIDTTDYPDFCDAFVCHAAWKDTGLPLSDDEIDALNEDYRSFIHACVMAEIF